MSPLHSISEAIEAVRTGQFVIVVDDEDRENEGDLIIAAEHMTPEKMAFMIRHTGGVVCMPVSNEIADQLDLPPMVSDNTSKFGTPFTVSIEAAEGVSTGISAEDRSHTVRTAINPVAKPTDLDRPGHIFPLRASDGGVLVRVGHTEASIDLCKLAGQRSGAVLSELMHDDGSMMRLPELKEFAKEHDIPLISIADLIAYRNQTDTCVRCEATTTLQTDTGEWKLSVYTDAVHMREHVALIKGDVNDTEPTLVRVHSECLTGDILGSQHCDCGHQLAMSMEMIEKEGKGVILYLRQEGRGIGLANKMKAYELQHQGMDTEEANKALGFAPDLRNYGIGAQILKDIGIGLLRLMTNNPKKIAGLAGYGLHVVEQVPIELADLSEKQRAYLKTKKEKMGHWLKHV